MRNQHEYVTAMTAGPHHSSLQPPTWSYWVSWSILALALAQVVLLAILPPPAWPVPPLVLPLSAAAQWGTFSVVLTVAFRLPSSDRLTWLGLATVPAFQAFTAALTRATGLLQIPVDTLTQLAVALAAAVLSIVTITRSSHVPTSRSRRLLQAVLDTALIGASALVVITTHPPGSIAFAGIPPSTLTAVISDSVLLVMLTLMILSNPRQSHLMRGYLWLSVICRLFGLGMEQAALIIHWGHIAPLVLAPLDTLRWGLLARGATGWSERVPAPRSGRIDPRHHVSDVTASIPWLAALNGLAIAALAGRLIIEPILVLALAGALRELGSGLHRRAWQARLIQSWDNEHRDLVSARQATQQQFDGLARLIHDQAAPINGLWYLQGELARGSAPHLSDRFAGHLDHLQTLADHLRAVLKAQPRPAVLRRCRVDVLPIISAAIDSARERADLGVVQVMPSIAARDTLVLGDQTAVRRILDNLLTNALDATPRQGVVVIEVWDDRAYPNFLTITVRDSGHGLSAEEQARIFEPGSVVRGPGLGLGLSIVRDLTTQMDGTCGVSSNPGAGSTFWVRLPCLDAATDTRSPTPPGHTE